MITLVSLQIINVIIFSSYVEDFNWLSAFNSVGQFCAELFWAGHTENSHNKKICQVRLYVIVYAWCRLDESHWQRLYPSYRETTPQIKTVLKVWKRRHVRRQQTTPPACWRWRQPPCKTSLKISFYVWISRRRFTNVSNSLHVKIVLQENKWKPLT